MNFFASFTIAFRKSSDISCRSAAVGSLRSLSHLNSLRRNTVGPRSHQMTKSRSYANLSGKTLGTPLCPFSRFLLWGWLFWGSVLNLIWNLQWFEKWFCDIKFIQKFCFLVDNSENWNISPVMKSLLII